jgi:hypothetical protein
VRLLHVVGKETADRALMTRADADAVLDFDEDVTILVCFMALAVLCWLGLGRIVAFYDKPDRGVRAKEITRFSNFSTKKGSRRKVTPSSGGSLER